MKYTHLISIILTLLFSCKESPTIESKTATWIERLKSFQFPKTTKDKSHLNEFTLIDKLIPLDVPLQKPKQGEWLYHHKESGQTFEEYKKIPPVMPNEVQNCIYLQPIGDFSDWQNKVIIYTREYIETFFNLTTILLPSLSDTLIPDGSRRVVYGREQLHTLYILDSLLVPNIPSKAIVFMAITEKDLYPKESWNFVFGQAYTQKRIGVSSIFRYYEKSTDPLDYNLCLQRLTNTSVHEIGHMFSIEHCTHAVCLMNGSNSLEESDSRPNILCSECLKKLYWNLEFDNIARLTKLKAFYTKHHLKRELEIVTMELEKMR